MSSNVWCADAKATCTCSQKCPQLHIKAKASTSAIATLVEVVWLTNSLERDVYMFHVAYLM